MTYVQREVVDITTDAGGDGTGYTGVVTGRVLAIRYVADGTNPYANTADFTVTAEASGLPVITVTNESASNTY